MVMLWWRACSLGILTGLQLPVPAQRLLFWNPSTPVHFPLPSGRFSSLCGQLKFIPLTCALTTWTLPEALFTLPDCPYLLEETLTCLPSGYGNFLYLPLASVFGLSLCFGHLIISGSVLSLSVTVALLTCVSSPGSASVAPVDWEVITILNAHFPPLLLSTIKYLGPGLSNLSHAATQPHMHF